MSEQLDANEVFDRLNVDSLRAVRACWTAETVAADLDRWLIEAGFDPDDVIQRWKLGSLASNRLYDARHVTARVVLLHLLPEVSVGHHVRLELIAQEFPLDSGLLSYLRCRAAGAEAEAALAAAHQGGEVLANHLLFRRVEVDGSDVTYENGGRIPIDSALDSLLGHPLSLWRFRNNLSGESTAFDLAVALRGDEFRDDVSKGLLKLFLNGPELSPSDFLNAFSGVHRSNGMLDVMLYELSSRLQVSDGFRRGPPVAEWLAALAGMHDWSSARLHTLLSFAEAVPQAAAAKLASAIQSAVTQLADTDPAASVNGALSLLRVVRLGREDARTLGWTDLEADCLRFVASLPLGEMIASVWDLWDAVPLRPGRRETPWAWLSGPVKRHWACRLSNRVADSHPIAVGVVEFVLSSAPREVAADLDHLIIDLVERFQLENFLQALSDRGSDICALRAGAMFNYLRLGKPP